MIPAKTLQESVSHAYAVGKGTVMRVTLCELRQKDVINLHNGHLLGRVADLAFSPEDGCVTALVIAGAFSLCGYLRGDRGGLSIDWSQIQKIGDDVVLVDVDDGL